MMISRKRKLDKSEKKLCKRRKYAPGHWSLTSMEIPGILYVLIFSYLPMVGLIMAFKDYKFNLGIFGSPWNGLDNFTYLFKSNTMGLLLRNTIGYNLAFQIFGIASQLFAALMLLGLTGRKWVIKLSQSAMLLPYFMSWIVISYISHAFLSNAGVINHILVSLGMDKISFYNEPKYWPAILILFETWKGLGYGTILYYGAMLGIDPTLYEAAELDGCNYFKKHRYITLPLISKTVCILTILNLGKIFYSDFSLFMYLPKDTGSLYSVTDVLDLYINRSLRIGGSIGQSTAIGLMQSIVGLVVVLAVNKIVSKFDEDSALF